MSRALIKNNRSGLFATSAVLCLLVACGPADEDNNSTATNNTTPANNSSRPTDTLDVTGSFASIYGFEEITASTWGGFAVVYAHNEENWVVLQTPMDAEFSPNTFTYVVYTEPAEDGSFYYCHAEFGIETEEEARNSTAMPDASSPDTGGCGDFPWTKLEPNDTFELIGEFTGDFGEESVTQTDWTTFGTTQTIIGYNNASNKAVRQLPPDDQFNPDKFNRIFWLEPDADGTFYYCTEVISADTAEEAWADPATSDASDPDNGGCGGFPWTKLTVKQ